MLNACLTTPEPSSFSTPIDVKSSETGPSGAFVSIASSCPTLSHLVTTRLPGTVYWRLPKWSGSFIIIQDHLSLWRPALPWPPCCPECLCWPICPKPMVLEPLIRLIFLTLVGMAYIILFTISGSLGFSPSTPPSLNCRLEERLNPPLGGDSPKNGFKPEIDDRAHSCFSILDASSAWS